MKESKYNFFFPENKDDPNSRVIAFNSMSCGLARMKREDYVAFQKGKINNFSELEQKLLNDLKRGGFLVEENCDELRILKGNMLQNRYNTNTFSLTLAPTLGCNFDCIYCYESDHSDYSKMSETTQDRIIDIINQQISVNRISSLSVTWYGGEPLLAMDVIEKLTDRMYSLCEEKDVQYFSDIITNGYLLSRATLEKLNQMHIQHMQITIDGPKEIHDSRRYLTGGYPTFDKIINNIKNNIDIILPVSLRVNVDYNNATRINELKKLFSDDVYKEKIHLYIAIVDAINDQYDNQKCLSMKDFVSLDTKFYVGFGCPYPSPVAHNCGADTPQSIVIGPDGSLYKCWNDIGIHALRVGTVDNLEAVYYKRYFDYLLYDATEDEQCRECNILPVCMGGCPNRRLTSSSHRCVKYKYDLETYIRNAVQHVGNLKKA